MASEGVPVLTPRESVDATHALATSLRLLLLDSVWTREARLASADETRDRARVDDLDAVVQEMESLLRECQDIGPRLAEIASRKESELQARFDVLGRDPVRGISSERLTEIADRLRHHVSRKADGNAARYLTQAGEGLRTGAEAEVAQLREELSRIRANGGSGGDMSEETAEHVAGIALGAGLLLGPEAAGAVIVVAEVIDCLF
jgi:hypothetical protein